MQAAQQTGRQIGSNAYNAHGEVAIERDSTASVPRAIGRLNHATTVAEDIIGTLVQRMEGGGVLRLQPPATPDSSSKAHGTHATCELALAIEDKAARLERMSEYVASIIARMEV